MGVSAGILLIIGERLEHKALKQSAKTGGAVSQIIGCAQYKTVRLSYGVQYRCKTVTVNTFAVACFPLAAKAGYAPCKFLKRVQVKIFSLRPLGFRPGKALLYKLCGVKAKSGTTVYSNQFFYSIYFLSALIITKIYFTLKSKKRKKQTF